MPEYVGDVTVKIICTDNYARESVADRLVASGIRSGREADYMLAALKTMASHEEYYQLVDDDHRLWRGMEELV